MKIRPLHDRVVLRRIEDERTTPGGIVIPDSATEKPMQGEIISVGNGKILDNGEVRALDLKAGDRVLLSVDTPTGTLDPTVSLRNVSDLSLANDLDRGPGSDALLGPYTIDTTGTYSARIASQANTLGVYDLRVEIVRGDTQIETDANDDNGAISNADLVALSQSGSLAVATVAGNVAAADGGAPAPQRGQHCATSVNCRRQSSQSSTSVVPSSGARQLEHSGRKTRSTPARSQ